MEANSLEKRIVEAIQRGEVRPGRSLVIEVESKTDLAELRADFARRLLAVDEGGGFLVTFHREFGPHGASDVAGRRFGPPSIENLMGEQTLPLLHDDVREIRVRALPMHIGEAGPPDFEAFQKLDQAGQLVFKWTQTDALAMTVFRNGEWSPVDAIPYSELSVSPNMQALHYGGALFEGMTAEWGEDGSCYVFGMKEHYERMKRGAIHLGLEPVTEDLFEEAVLLAIQQNARFIPENGRLYVRPHMADIGALMRVGSSGMVGFFVEVTPVGKAYFGTESRVEGENAPMQTFAIPDNRVRAAAGHGDVKAAGNYAPTVPMIEAVNDIKMGGVLFLDRLVSGFDQDSVEFKAARICETHASNIIFFEDLGGGRYKLVTPSLDHGDILPGNTRNLLIEEAKKLGWAVEQRNVTVGDLQKDQVCAAANCGTAAILSSVDRLEFVHIDEGSDVTAQKTGISIDIRSQDEVNKNPTPEPVQILLKKVMAIKSASSGDEDKRLHLTQVPLIRKVSDVL